MNAAIKTTDKPAHLRHSLKRGRGIYHVAREGHTLCGAEGYSYSLLTVITRSAEELGSIESRGLICRTCTRSRSYHSHMREFAQELNEAEAAPTPADFPFLRTMAEARRLRSPGQYRPCSCCRLAVAPRNWRRHVKACHRRKRLDPRMRNEWRYDMRHKNDDSPNPYAASGEVAPA